MRSTPINRSAEPLIAQVLLRMHKQAKSILFATTVSFLLLSTHVHYANAFEKGDVFAAIGNGQVVRFNKDLQWLETFNTGLGGFTTGMAFDSEGSLLVTNFSDGTITKITRLGEIEQPNPFITVDDGNESIVFDSLGNFYIGVADGSKNIFKFDPSGKLIQRFDVETEEKGADWIDLAADQRTIYYTSEGRRILRFDIEANEQLPDFAKLDDDGGRAFALRILDDGGLLVADTLNIKRLDAKGRVIQKYDIENQQDDWFALNIDPGGKSFWSGGFTNNTLAKFDLSTTEVLATTKIEGSLGGVTVAGEIPVALTQGDLPTDWQTNWLEVIMDTTTLLATFALLAFLVERLTNGAATLLGYWGAWQQRFEITPTLDPAAQAANVRNRRVALFAMGAVISVVGAILADLKLLEQLRLADVPDLGDQIITGLLIASGGDPIREIVQQRSLRRDAQSEPTPLRVSGTLVLQQAPPTTGETVHPEEAAS